MPFIEEKTYYCVDAYACHLRKMQLNQGKKCPFTTSRGNNVRRCPKGARCRGAHHPEEFKTKDFIRKFNSMDFTKLNLGKYNDAITSVLNNCIGKVSDAELSSNLMKLKNLNFVEKLQLWVKLYFYKGELKKRGVNVSIKLGIEFSGNGLVEDHMWALERCTHMCPKHMEVMKKIHDGSHLTIRDTCLGGDNCKFGCHSRSKLVNISDLMTGVSDDRYTKEMYDTECRKIHNKISEVQSKIDTLTAEIKEESSPQNGWTTHKSRKGKKSDKEERLRKMKGFIVSRNRILKELPRQVHLTEKGLVPLKVYLDRKAELKRIEVAKLESAKDVSDKKRRVIRRKKKN